MEHLPPSSSLVRPLPDILYLSHSLSQYTAPFPTYPSRCGINTEILEHSSLQLHGYSLNEILPFLQEWLFFGLMQELFSVASDMKFDRQDFIRYIDSPGHQRQAYISTMQLSRYLCYWEVEEHLQFSRSRARIQEGYVQHAAHINDTLRLANRCLNAVVKSSAANRWMDADSGMLLMSLVVVGEGLSDARYGRIKVFDKVNLTEIKWELPGYLRNLALHSGFCSAEFEQLKRECSSPSCLYYIVANFERTVLGKVHSDCTEVRCVANVIDESTYRTKHVKEEGCDCDFLFTESSPKSASEILDDGKIPVVRLSAPDGGIKRKVIVQESQPEIDGTIISYVAISHVWSDGLGNQNNNSLPLCQLEKIQSFVDSLYDGSKDSVPFWIDTLCVPLDRKHRGLAIRRMTQTYREADKVLVLDSSLQSASASAPVVECMMRIKCSFWTTRLWTFQEGALAQSLYFVFGGGIVSASNLERINAVESLRFIEIGRDLTSFDADDIMKNPTSVKLVRAIVQGFQDDKTSEVYLGRHSAAIMVEWQKIVAQCASFPSSEDLTLYKFLQQRTVGIIALEGLKTLGKVTGASTTRSTISGKTHTYRGKDRSTGVIEHASLNALWHSLSGRSTTRSSDETLCLGGLLGVDVGELLKCSGIERMKKFFTLLKSISLELVLTTAPKIKDEGYRWAPQTILLAGTVPSESSLGRPRGVVQPRGLLFTSDAITFSKENITFPKSTELNISYPMGSGDQRSGNILQLIGSEGERTPLWPEFLSVQCDKFAVIYRHAYGDGLAFIVSLVTAEEGVTYGRYEALVNVKRQRSSGDPKRFPFSGLVEGCSVDYVEEQQWCIA